MMSQTVTNKLQPLTGVVVEKPMEDRACQPPGSRCRARVLVSDWLCGQEALETVIEAMDRTGRARGLYENVVAVEVLDDAYKAAGHYLGREPD